MKKLSMLSICVFLAACAPAPEQLPTDPLPPAEIVEDQAASSMPEPISPSDLSAEEEPYTGPFHETDRGELIGTITLTGYPIREEVCNDDSWDDVCDARATYVFLKITGGMNPAMESFLAQNQGNAFIRDGAIGLGCEMNVEKNPAFAPILAATAAAQVTITLSRPFEPAGRGVPSCYAHFDIVSVGA